MIGGINCGGDAKNCDNDAFTWDSATSSVLTRNYDIEYETVGCVLLLLLFCLLLPLPLQFYSCPTGAMRICHLTPV